jgi:hypothetical protein
MRVAKNKYFNVSSFLNRHDADGSLPTVMEGNQFLVLQRASCTSSTSTTSD